jgi:hypothetical protein
MDIAVIGWGSLIWSPTTLRLRTRWHSDGPRLPIEYARISRDGRLTLVIHENCAEQTTLWAEWDGKDVTTAQASLQQREGCALTAIHGVQRHGPTLGSPSAFICGCVGQWLIEKHFDAAIWTGIDSNWQQKRQSNFTVDGALSYLRGLTMAPGAGTVLSRAREYIRNTPAQVQTEVRRRARAEFGWTDADLPNQFVTSSSSG